MAELIVSVGMRFGRLTVLRKAERQRYWECSCDCGSEKIVRKDHLVHRKIQSCGCFAQECRTKHGMCGIPEYHIWEAIIHRCSNQKTVMYHAYGGRGIYICERWRNSFANFLADMGHRPSAEFEIDRIDNDRGYEPGNCRWATRREQMRNLRRNVVLEFRGEKMIVTDWASRIGISVNGLRKRLRSGMTVEQCLTTPVNEKFSSRLRK